MHFQIIISHFKFVISITFFKKKNFIYDLMTLWIRHYLKLNPAWTFPQYLFICLRFIMYFALEFNHSDTSNEF